MDELRKMRPLHQRRIIPGNIEQRLGRKDILTLCINDGDHIFGLVQNGRQAGAAVAQILLNDLSLVDVLQKAILRNAGR